MEFKDLVAISGKSGLYEIVKTRQDGLIVRQIGGESKNFVSSRKHNFTPLENIGVYMQSGDTVELKEVFDNVEANSINRVSDTATAKEMRDFFRTVLPDHDEEKVRVSDMKKILQWHEQLTNFGWFTQSGEEE